MPQTGLRGAQTVLDGDGQRIARGTFAATFDANHTAQRNAHAAGTVPDGNKPDGTTRTGLAATDFIQGQTPLQQFANDAAAATGGIAVGQLYRNNSQVMVRVS